MKNLITHHRYSGNGIIPEAVSDNFSFFWNLGSESGPVLRHPPCPSLCVLHLPLSGGCGRMAALWPAVGAQTHLCVRHSHSVAGRHRQPAWVRAAGYPLSPPPLPAGVPVNQALTLFCGHTGAMYPTSMRINEEGRLVVNFKTEARFRGQFVMSHPGNTQHYNALYFLTFIYFWRPKLRFLLV